MKKTEGLFLIFRKGGPVCPAFPQKLACPHHVCLHKGFRRFDGTVHVGFSRKVDYPGGVIFFKKGFYLRTVADIAPSKNTLTIRKKGLKRIHITGVGKRVKNNYCFPLLQEMTHEICADKSCASGDQYAVFLHFLPLRSNGR